MPQQKAKSVGRKPTSVRLTPDNQDKLNELIKLAADQSDAINIAISDSWWLRIGMKRQAIMEYADELTDYGKNEPGK